MNNSFTNWKRTIKIVSTADAGGEYILPNDKPDVKRIVHVLSAVKKNGCYSGDRDVTAEGEITYSILYAGDDGELHSVGYACPLTAKYQLKDGEEGDFAYAEVLSTDTQVRLSNPRKFSIKSRTRIEFSVFRREEITPYIEGVQDNGLQYDEKTGVTYSVSSERNDNIPLSLDVHIPENLPEPASVVCAYAVPGMPAVTPYDSKAEVSFCMEFLFICKSTDGELFSFGHKEDVSHEIDADGITLGSVCRANVCASDVSCSLTTDTAGEMRVVEVDLTYDVEVLYETAMNGVYISDMYSTDYECREVFSDMTLRRALPVFSAHYTVSGNAENESGGEIIAATAECDKYTLAADKNGAVIEGAADVYLIKKNDTDFEGQTASVPFRISVPYSINEENENNVNVKASMPAVREDNGKIYIDTEIYVTLCGAEYSTVQTAATLTITDIPAQKEKAPLLLYRPAPEETIWDVAKRFKVSMEEIRKANESNKKKVYIIP